MNESLSDFALARALGQAAMGVPDVAGIYGGQLGEIATYGPGGRVSGVRVRREAGQVLVEIHLTITYDPKLNVLVLAETVRSRLAAELRRLTVAHVGAIDVVVADLAVAAAATR
ncbi:MAG TPA: Asp23/Gls24 family envelope stress response protein [Roseiflexaceae bacterium]|nr:Asp23/Gls24 family envelope stress response protein [Roseiflexaceae bacterium]